MGKRLFVADLYVRRGTLQLKFKMAETMIKPDYFYHKYPKPDNEH